MTLGDLRGRSILGTWFHAPQEGAIEVLEDTVIVIDASGVIEAVLAPDHPAYDRAVMTAVDATERFMLPGFVDLHVHAPQYPQLGQALDEPLEVWLGKYTFPLEARYADLDFARPRYDALVGDLLANGTTTALYFATADLEPTKLLADLAMAHGQRALIGKVVMDHHSNPPFYRDSSATAAIADTRSFIDYVRAHPGNADGRVLPVITPRFIPSCTDEALRGLGALARECQCHVQTHCSESDWAHGYALERFGETDTTALERFGLLGRQTVLAHSNFITDADMGTIARAGSAIAHCPVSNAYFANAVFPLRRALDKGLHAGLGTDISGGPIASIFDAARATVQVSRMLETGVDSALPQAERGMPGSAVTMATAFHLATAGGGIALDLPIGRFAPGYRFDAIAIDPATPDGGIRLFGETAPLAILEKILYTASRANIAEVWVDGRSVGGAKS